MDGVKRKRVTRVGSGAYSVYLPKKWIDAWTPQQQAGREVDLHAISGSLLIVPALQDRSLRLAAPDDTRRLPAMLRSAYVRGHDDVAIAAGARPFSNDDIAGARELLRHLDERIVASVGPDRIAFRVPHDGLGPPDTLASLGARLVEAVDLAAECIEHAGTDPERVAHAARLLRAIQEEDIGRILHQTLRRVATLDLPIATVTDLQLLDLCAFLLHGVGSQAAAVAFSILADLGVTPADLGLPRDVLRPRLRPAGPLPPVARDLLQGHRASMRSAQDLLRSLLPALRDADLEGLAAAASMAAQVRNDLQQRVFEAVTRHWGDPVAAPDAARAYAAYQLANPLANLVTALGACAEQAILFLAARPQETA